MKLKKVKINLLSLPIGHCGRFGLSIIEIEPDEIHVFVRALFSIIFDLYSEVLIIHLFFINFEFDVQRYLFFKWHSMNTDTKVIHIGNRLTIY